MDRPQVIIHNLISLEGRLVGFPADAGLHYELASRLPHQAVLTGSGTMLAAAASEGIDLSEEDPEPLRGMRVTSSAAAGDPRPLLVIVDGQGRVTRYSWLREQRFWRDVLALCSAGLSRAACGSPRARASRPPCRTVLPGASATRRSWVCSRAKLASLDWVRHAEVDSSAA
jgi:riboflavin biosynthesis pyrimidine reductase